MENFGDYSQQLDYSIYLDHMFKIAEEHHLKKNEYLGLQDTPAQYMGYIKEGAIRYTRINEEGKEHIVGYSFTGDFVADYPSFIHKQPRLVNIQAVRNTLLYTITRSQFMDFVNQNQEMQELYRKTTEGYMSAFYKRLLSFYCETPEDRYLNLIEQYPGFLKMITLKEVASYIGVTPETLSHIRKRLKAEGKIF